MRVSLRKPMRLIVGSIFAIAAATLVAAVFYLTFHVSSAHAILIGGFGSVGEVSEREWDLAHKLVNTEMELEAEVDNLTQAFDDLAEIKTQTELELMQENAQLRERIYQLEQLEIKRLNHQMKGHPPSFGSKGEQNDPWKHHIPRSGIGGSKL